MKEQNFALEDLDQRSWCSILGEFQVEPTLKVDEQDDLGACYSYLRYTWFLGKQEYCFEIGNQRYVEGLRLKFESINDAQSPNNFFLCIYPGHKEYDLLKEAVNEKIEKMQESLDRERQAKLILLNTFPTKQKG